MGVTSFKVVNVADNYRAVFHDNSYTSGLTNVRVYVYNDSGLVSFDSMTEIGSTGLYYKDLSLAAGNYILVRTDIISGYKMPAETIQVVYDNLDNTVFASIYDLVLGFIFTIEPTLLSIQNSISFISAIELGDWKLEGSQLIFRDKDSGAELARFNLLDASGNPTTDKEEVNEVQGV